MEQNSNLLEVRGLYKSYTIYKGTFGKTTERTVLSDVNLYIKKGEVLGLVGESGSGKSTLGRCITGLIDDYKGEILFDSQPISNRTRRDKRELTRFIQMVFQDPYSSLNPSKRIGWLLEEPLRARHIGTPRERRDRAIEMLELVGLDSDFFNRYPNELSGGQRQRVSIGCALMLHPKLLVADEPVSSLDVSIQAQILNLLLDLKDKLDLSILFISHNLKIIGFLCDRVAVMHEGTIVETGETRELFANPTHPYTKSLLYV